MRQRRPAVDNLTPRQIRYLHLLSQGMTYKEIAAVTHVTLSTVMKSMQTLRRKIGAVNTPHAVALYIGDTYAEHITWLENQLDIWIDEHKGNHE
jgi:DNA-binding CsgD family transcriptional regulator